ncbi:aromatic compound dioxygenase [Tothia fuscella]|uniref:Aromatic compound dioxygenase n=1 Tax=Tothia fuscella TaxID=1048955 RepID=A0A9P4NGC9_9PEZI|nr:aromatic compound dioxygenase [Tothia fuscella]
MHNFFKLAIVGALGVAALCSSHAMDRETETKIFRRIATPNAEALDRCSGSIEARQFNEDTRIMRFNALRDLRVANGVDVSDMKIVRRSLDDLKKWEALKHDHTGLITKENAWYHTKPQCALAPEDIVGPFYYPGELLRTQLWEDQAGIPLYLEIQFVDVNGCNPLEGIFTSIWATNATGVYSRGPVEVGNAGVNTHFQRGAWTTASDGRVSFALVFPGHYAGRPVHVHVMARKDVKVSKNKDGEQIVTGHSSDKSVHHVGQLYWDESVRAKVESNAPYTDNHQQVITNEQDPPAQGQAGPDYDPFVNYVYIDPNDMTKGIYGWISIGIDPVNPHPGDFSELGDPSA